MTTIAIGDYWKLVPLLGQAFDGTAQAGSTLPIYYDEFGVESQIPPAKASLYTGVEPTTTHPVDEQTQALYYREAVQLAFCQPNVRGLFLFHTVDETDLNRWQSGVYYADGTPKASLAGTKLALEEARRGVVAHCSWLHLVPKPALAQKGRRLVLTCDLDCTYVAQLYRLPGQLVATRRGRATGGAGDHAAAAGPGRGRPLPAAGHRAGRRESAASRCSVSCPSVTRIRVVEGQYVAYTFYRVDPAWRRLPLEERRAAKDAFAEVIDDFADRFDHLRMYTTTGVRPETDFFLWKITERYDALGELGAALNGTPLAGWLETPYSYLATTKASQYTSARKARKITPYGLPYLVVYPFVKVRPWYLLTEDDRQRAMNEHMVIGREEFPGIRNHTTYSFGIDDQEFMTAFECDEPADFMHLMLRLRDSEASSYTERDTPIFVGRHVPVREALDALDGAVARVEASS